MYQRIIYPFTAIVGQEQMKRALVLNAVNPRIGGVLIRGERGTAKSTAARALAALLPDIDTVADCPFGCHPTRRDMMCDNCRERLDGGEKLPIARRKTRMIDLPVSATEDRVVGTLDIERAIQKGERRFEPGVLASANRGVLYVDEVNLLADHVVDLLLDSAAMGIYVVEREGSSCPHPARFILIGTMNPEEGDLRPQLLDRFALTVNVQGLAHPAQRMAILERHVAFEENPDRFCAEWETQERQLTEQIRQAREIVEHVAYSRQDLAAIAQLTASLRVDGHRADLVILKTARAHAAFEGREAITQRDILVAAELALPHRVRHGPFQEAQVNLYELEERMQEIQEQSADAPVEAMPQPDEQMAQSKKKRQPI